MSAHSFSILDITPPSPMFQRAWVGEEGKMTLNGQDWEARTWEAGRMSNYTWRQKESRVGDAVFGIRQRCRVFSAPPPHTSVVPGQRAVIFYGEERVNLGGYKVSTPPGKVQAARQGWVVQPYVWCVAHYGPVAKSPQGPRQAVKSRMVETNA
jgi:hypothetical protein